MEMLIRANKKEILTGILEFFGSSKRRAQVYLAVDGERSVAAIAALLKMKGPNVSAELTRLKEFGLIEVKSVSGLSMIYKKRKLDRILGISRELERIFKLRENSHGMAGPNTQASPNPDTGLSPGE